MEVSTNKEQVNRKEKVKLFSIPHRPNDDDCAKDAKDIFNQSGFDYSITNFYDASRQSLIDFSSDQTKEFQHAITQYSPSAFVHSADETHLH